jgi:alkylation response protein AidB-like acyl-CoA dehydrogenase
VASVINRLGTTAQKERYLGGIASGRWTPTFALSDLTGGSNVRNMGTRAEKCDDGRWKINGRKVHIHACDVADLWLIFAGSEGGQEAILFEGNEGVVLEQTFQPFGFRSAPCFQILFKDVMAREDGLLGDRGKGLMAALTGALNYTRIGNASIVIGIARAAFDVAMSFMMGRKLQNGYLSDQQAVQHILADLSTELDAATLLRWDAAVKYDRGGSQAVRESSQAKLYATEKATHICGTLLRLLGAYGSYEDFPLSDYFTSCKTLEIGSGASEIHRNNIARELLKEFDARFESGDLMKWTETPVQENLLLVNERSAQVLEKLGRGV